MAGLLISVRDALEAQQALRGGADVIDIKEPRHGALGAASPLVWRDVLQQVQGRRPVSCALGELAEPDVLARAAQACGMCFAKVGLSGMPDTGRPDTGRQNSSQQAAIEWPRRWQQLQATLPAATQLVAVMYADWQRAAAPRPLEILARCAALGCRWALLDTFDKSSGNLLAILDEQHVREIVRRAKQLDMQLVLAGSLALADVPHVLSLAVDYLGIRGAACIGGRGGRICKELVRQLSSTVHGFIELPENCGQKQSSIA